VGIDIHEKRRLSGNADHNPTCRGHGSEGAGSTIRKGYFTHHWSYYKAKAVARSNAAEKA